MDVLIGAASAKAPASGSASVLGSASGSASTSYSALFVLMVTIVGFVFPMVFIYPPVAPQPSDILNETHTLLGSEGDEKDEKDKNDKADKRTGPRLAAICIRPLRWCAGISVDRCRVLPTGLAGNDLFVLAQLLSPFPETAGETVGGGEKEGKEGRKETSWSPITPTQFPRLAQLQVELWRPDVAKAKKAQERMRADYRAEREPTMGQTFAVVRFPWDGVSGPPGSGSRVAVARLWARFLAKLARGWRAEPEREVVLPVVEEEAAEIGDMGAQAKASKATPYPIDTVHFDHGLVRARNLSAELPRELQLYLGVSNRLGLFQLAKDDKNDPGLQLVVAGSSSASQKDVLADAQKQAPASLTVSGVSVEDQDSWNTLVFRAETADTEARFRVSGRAGPTLLTPLFEQQRPELRESVLEVGMAMHVHK